MAPPPTQAQAAAHGLLHRLRGVREAWDAGHAGGKKHDPARLPHREGGVGVPAEVEVLHRERGGLVLADQVAYARVDLCEPPLERHSRAGVDHAAFERGKPPALRQNNSIPGVGGARVYAEDDH